MDGHAASWLAYTLDADWWMRRVEPHCERHLEAPAQRQSRGHGYWVEESSRNRRWIHRPTWKWVRRRRRLPPDDAAAAREYASAA
jgi:hypothetical protein